LSSRALRFYEARGLVRPLRAASGRRYYGPAELERVHQIVTLKRAGLSLSDIAALAKAGPIDLAALIDAQIAAVTEQSRQLGAMRALLLTIKSRIERSEPIDVATFCSLIQQGEQAMSTEKQAWQPITDRYMSARAKADFAAAETQLVEGFDQQDYSAQWRDLGGRIKAALPLDPGGPEALGFVREWFALLAPFTAVATPAMWEGSRAMYADMGSWQGGDADPGFDAEVWGFVQQAATRAREAGEDIGPLPAWMQG